jgi:uracil phosphoribosyltransferase
MMSDSMLDLMPNAAVHHIGMYRSKHHDTPIQYYNRLPGDNVADVAYVVDPCIASSNTVSAVVSILKKWGAKRVVVIAAIAAQSGINKLLAKHPDCSVFVGAVDEQLSETGMILPGIGDAGDRSFGTPVEDEVELVVEEQSGPAKKKAKK